MGKYLAREVSGVGGLVLEDVCTVCNVVAWSEVALAIQMSDEGRRVVQPAC